jgi:hypothetical protein
MRNLRTFSSMKEIFKTSPCRNCRKQIIYLTMYHILSSSHSCSHTHCLHAAWKTGLFWGWVLVCGGGRQKEIVTEDEHGGYIVYSYMKIEE